MQPLEDLKQTIAEYFRLDERDDEDEEPEASLVGARLKPKPQPGASSIALTEPV
jgi:hypothetical protein